MPSLRANFFNAATRLLVRRRQWGRGEHELASEARRIMGAPKILQKLWSVGLRIEKDESQNGEWITPKDADPGAVILYIHGGGFVSCSARTHRPITASLARRTGLKVFAADYRLAPEHRFPGALDDVFSAYQKLREITGGARIALAGDSAGGGLVLSLLLRIRETGLEPPACAVCFSPWTDLTGSGGSVETNKDADAMFYRENIAEFARPYLGDTPANNPLASPVFANFQNLPPILFQVSSTEILLDDSRRIHQKIIETGGISELEIFDNLSHCWQMLNGFIPEAGQALRQATDFIRKNIHHRGTESTEKNLNRDEGDRQG
jgi:acetyl esterase/lipase